MTLQETTRLIQAMATDLAYYARLTTTPYYLLTVTEQADLDRYIGF